MKSENKIKIFGNWKMNPQSLEEAKRIIRSVKRISSKNNNVSVVIFPPSVYLQQASKLKDNFYVGAQDLSVEKEGAFTGEISSYMLKDLGCDFVLVGHSERRKMGETSDVVAKKVHSALDSGLIPVLCIGESSRDQNGLYLEELSEQIKSSLKDVLPSKLKNIILAYEPVWKIGAQEPMSPREIHETLIFIRKIIADNFDPDMATKIQILYGGSVNPRTALDIVKDGYTNGLLIGRESLNTSGFSEIISAF